MIKASTVWPEVPPKNIIVRMPNWIGDLVMATPVLEDLRHHFPDAQITVMTLAGHATLLEHDPHIDEIFRFRRPSGWIHRSTHYDIFEPLRRGDYDLGVLLTGSFSSAWWFCRGKVRNRIGYRGHWRSLLLNKAVDYPPDKERTHQVIQYKRLLQPLGIPLSMTSPKLYIGEKDLYTAWQLLAKNGVKEGNVLVGVNPGAAYGTAKCWLPERFRTTTQRLLSHPNYHVVYFGDHGTAPLVNDICKDLNGNIINLAGKTSLPELVALIRLCTVLLTNDSGPMHIAAAVGTPPLALFGSTSDVKTGPYGIGRVIHKNVECSPCYKRICPIDFRCMKRIESDEVYTALQAMISERQS